MLLSLVPFPKRIPKWWCGISASCRSHGLTALKYHVSWHGSCQMHREDEGEEAGARGGNAAWTFTLLFFLRPKARSSLLLWSPPVLHPSDCSGLCKTQESLQQGWRRWRNLCGVAHGMTELLGYDSVGAYCGGYKWVTLDSKMLLTPEGTSWVIQHCDQELWGAGWGYFYSPSIKNYLGIYNHVLKALTHVYILCRYANL